MRKKLNNNIVDIIFGVISIFIGSIIFYTKIGGSRYGVSVEGAPAQLSGIVLALFGFYRIVSAFRRLRKSKGNSTGNE